MLISEDAFGREMHYQLVKHFVSIMLPEGLITEVECCHVELKFRDKYKLLIGILLSGKYIMLPSSRIDIFISRKDRGHRRDIPHVFP